MFGIRLGLPLGVGLRGLGVGHTPLGVESARDCAFSVRHPKLPVRGKRSTRRDSFIHSSVALSTYGTYTHSAARVPARTVTQPSPQKLYTAYVPLFLLRSSVVVADLSVTSMSALSRPSSSSVSGDGFWLRALAGLPVALADGLRTAELDDPTVLSSYPRMDWEEAFSGLRALSCTTVVGVAPAPSGAASSSHSSISSSDSRFGIALCSSSWSAASAASGAGSTGGDPRTDHFVPETGGDPTTDHALSVFVGKKETMAATCPPYRPGRLATATAFSNSSATASAMLAADDEHSDGFPNSSSHRDELPSSAVSESSSLLDRILHRRHSIDFSRDFHSGESSESLRQSQLDQVQIVPATLIPSELSAHQMAARSDGSLARSRVDGHPTSALSLQDKVLYVSILFLFLQVR